MFEYEPPITEALIPSDMSKVAFELAIEFNKRSAASARNWQSCQAKAHTERAEEWHKISMSLMHTAEIDH